MREGEKTGQTSGDSEGEIKGAGREKERERGTEVEQRLCDVPRTLLSDPVGLRRAMDVMCDMPRRPSRGLVWSSSADWLPCWSCG